MSKVKDKEEKDLKYYWDHPKEYKRLTADKLKNEPTIELLEFVIEGIKDEQNTIIQEVKEKNGYDNPDFSQHVKTMINTLNSDFIESISFGHNDEMICEFVERLPQKYIDHELNKLRNEADISIALVNLDKTDKTHIRAVKKTYKKLKSNFIKALTHGRNESMAQNYVNDCPKKGVFSGLDVRQKMIDWREANGITLEVLSMESGVSKNLLELIEDGGVTHPDIARQIGNVYHLSEDDILELMPENMRIGGNKYDPDKYKSPPSHNGKRMKIVSNTSTQIDQYIHENRIKVMRRYGKR